MGHFLGLKKLWAKYHSKLKNSTKKKKSCILQDEINKQLKLISSMKLEKIVNANTKFFFL